MTAEGSVISINEARELAGYRTGAWLLGESKNSVQRIFQIKGWQARWEVMGQLESG